jgi:1-acyl-sn-glycerol-3-phosphate acyltransferase
MQWLLAPLRAVVVSAHVLLGVAIVLVIFPFAGQVARNRINRSWSRVLIALCGARLISNGAAIPAALQRDGVDPRSAGRLALANHVSWMDIFAINAVLPSRFVAKAEIGQWPLLGLLVSGGGTLYIERGRRRAVAAINRTVSEHLKVGETIVVFAEGTTTDGSELLPFHSNLIAPALDVGATIWPIAIRYTERGARTSAAAFVGEMGLLTSLARVLVAQQLVVEVAVLPAIAATDAINRHAIARAARAAIARQLGMENQAAGTRPFPHDSSATCDTGQSR